MNESTPNETCAARHVSRGPYLGDTPGEKRGLLLPHSRHLPGRAYEYKTSELLNSIRGAGIMIVSTRCATTNLEDGLRAWLLYVNVSGSYVMSQAR